MKQKVCIITSVHPPFDIRIFHKQAKSLVSAGYDVTLIQPHARQEIVAGIKVINLQKPRNRFERMTKTTWSAFRKALAVKADVYHFHDPELIPIGILLKMIGHKVIYDVHEDTPRLVSARTWLPWVVRKPIAWFMSCMEWVGAMIFDAIISVTPKINDRFPISKTTLIQNYPIMDEMLVRTPIPYNEREAVFAYVGIISRVRSAEEIVRSFELISDQFAPQLDMAGEFDPSSLEETLRKLPGWAAVRFHGEVSRTEVAKILSRARAGLVLFHPVHNHIYAQPNKMFEYMSAGLPVIASDFPLWRRIIDVVNCGLLVDPMNPKAIAAAMRWLLDNPAEAEAMGQRGLKAVQQVYNWDIESVKLISLYKKLLTN